MVRTTMMAAGLVGAMLAFQGCKKDQPVQAMQSPAYESRPLSEPVTMELPPSPRPTGPALIDPVGYGWPTAESAPAVISVEPAAQRTYVVQRGDTLWSIASRHYGDGKKLHQIAAANGISDPNKLQVGQRLIIP